LRDEHVRLVSELAVQLAQGLPSLQIGAAQGSGSTVAMATFETLEICP
jgi:hypothetical protein